MGIITQQKTEALKISLPLDAVELRGKILEFNAQLDDIQDKKDKAVKKLKEINDTLEAIKLLEK